MQIRYTPNCITFLTTFTKEYTMEQKEEQRFQLLYQRHLQLLKLQGKSKEKNRGHTYY